MLRLMIVGLLLCGSLLNAEEPETFKLAAPKDWSGESIELPPGFAPEMKLRGLEHIRFAPGMMKSSSPTFFSYAFVFELEQKTALTEEVIQEEFLKYYRGLCKVVLNGKAPDVDPSQFTFKLKRQESETNSPAGGQEAIEPVTYEGTLEWVEPFATRKPQTLKLEIRTWTHNRHNYLFACVSPQAKDKPIWKQLHTIRDNYLKTSAETVKE